MMVCMLTSCHKRSRESILSKQPTKDCTCALVALLHGAVSHNMVEPQCLLTDTFDSGGHAKYMS
eukprot:1350751-Amphidinium_carterae.1